MAGELETALTPAAPDSLFGFDANGELSIIVHFSHDNPNYQAHLDAHRKMLPGGVTVQAAPGIAELPPVNVDGKAVHHDLNKTLQPIVAKASAAVGVALQAKIDAHELRLAEEAQAAIERQAKADAFLASLDSAQRAEFEAVTDPKTFADFVASLSPEQKALLP